MEDDITKTDFRTHEGHYSELRSAFQANEPPAKFEALMNVVFKPFYSRFVLVFFNDIFIYSHSAM